MKLHCYTTALLALLLVACSASQSGARADQQAILTRMHATWDRPDSKLDAGPLVVEGDYALADWTQGQMGGRALLRRRHGQWSTVLCAGDGIRDVEGLAAAGVPAAIAGRLATRLAEAEKQVPAERLAQMSAFMGVVQMDTEGTHGQHR